MAGYLQKTVAQNQNRTFPSHCPMRDLRARKAGSPDSESSKILVSAVTGLQWHQVLSRQICDAEVGLTH